MAHSRRLSALERFNRGLVFADLLQLDSLDRLGRRRAQVAAKDVFRQISQGDLGGLAKRPAPSCRWPCPGRVPPGKYPPRSRTAARPPASGPGVRARRRFSLAVPDPLAPIYGRACTPSVRPHSAGLATAPVPGCYGLTG